MYGYIYKITNNINGKIYIGQHKATKFEPNKYFGSGTLLFKAFDKYGKSNFTCELLIECTDQKDMNIKEQYYIQQYNSQDPNIGYNITNGGFGGGEPVRSEETKTLISNSSKGKIVINDGVRNYRISKDELSFYLEKGFIQGPRPFKRSDNFKQKLSLSTTGKKSMYKISGDNSIICHWVYPQDFDKYLAEGWNFGRKPKKEYVPKSSEKGHHMHKDGINKVIPESQIEEYLLNGWTLGCKFNQGRSPYNKGKSASLELKQKLSKAHTGEKHPPERIKKHADSIRGRKYMHKDGVNKLIPLGEEEHYLQLGWQLGKTSNKS